MITVQIEGLNELLDDVKKAGYQVKPLVQAALQNSTAIVQRNVRQEAPHKTGSMQRSVMTSISYPSATVEVNEPYGIMVENGTRPHIILPKNKKALFWKGALNPYKAVHHPGTRANPFFQRGIDKSTDAIYAQFAKVAERLITIMAGE